MICTHQPRQQEHGGQLHTDHVRSKQGDPNCFGSSGAGSQARGCASCQIDDFDNQDAGQNHRASPDSRRQPLSLRFRSVPSEVEHHHDEKEKHHDGACVDDGLERRDEGRPKREEHDRHRKQRHDQVKKRVNEVQAR